MENLFELSLEGKEVNTYIEVRENNVLSISNGQLTLEVGWIVHHTAGK